MRTPLIARDRLGEGLCGCLDASVSRSAFRRVLFEVLEGSGGGSFTPARRAFESPIAMACRDSSLLEVKRLFERKRPIVILRRVDIQKAVQFRIYPPQLVLFWTVRF